MKRTKKQSVFQGIKEGLEQAIRYADGTADKSEYRTHVPKDINVRAIRRATGLTQEAFALRYGFTLSRLRDLEQKRTRPDSVVRAYLTVIERQPKAVTQALRVA